MTGTYEHDSYQSFLISDPKLRHIHKASVRDRLLHQAIFRVLYPTFDQGFISDSFSCRLNKGTHLAVSQLERFLKKSNQNNHRPVFALKCDVKKFFDSINHEKMLGLIKRKISCEKSLWLIEKVISSFEKTKGVGLPLGNVTSQLFANIYLNEFDQFIKHDLKIKYYLRYCDDFIILDPDQNALKNILQPIGTFLTQRLNLKLHENKITLRKHIRGVDFLGYVVLPYHRVLRTKTKNRLFKKLNLKRESVRRGVITTESYNQTLQSYFGVLSHCSGFKISEYLRAQFGVDKSGKNML
ncbi:MAG: reverse transcriptase/maturase family protein [Patescibacteria group bacterium]